MAAANAAAAGAPATEEWKLDEKLGEYILVDYVQHKRKKLARR